MRTIDEITQPFIENFEAPDPIAKPGYKKAINKAKK
jgi:hypothetical protein